MTLGLLIVLMGLQEPAGGSLPRTFDINQGLKVSYQPSALAFSPDGHWLAASVDGKWKGPQRVHEVSLIDVESGKPPSYWQFEYQVHSLRFTPDSKYLAIGTCLRDPKSPPNDEWFCSTVFFLELNSGAKAPMTCNEQWGCLVALAFSSDGKLLATGGSNETGSSNIGLQQVATRKGLAAWATHRDRIERLVFSPNNKLLGACGRDSVLFAYDVEARKQLPILAGHTDGVVGMAFTPNGKRLVSVGNHDGLKWWDLTTGDFSSTKEVGAQAKCAAPSPDGKVLWIASKTKQGYDLVRIDLHSGKSLPSLTLPFNEPIKWMAFSADGMSIATDGEKGRLHVWDVSKLSEIRASK
jgi:dipeptidyl aminopeptidase/acylaminoacyl peptidase